MSDLRPPSPLLQTHADPLRKVAALGPTLDLACGRGRNAIAAAAMGTPVIGIDRNVSALTDLRNAARARRVPVVPVRADLETGRGIPVRAESCGAILVFRFLFRPLAEPIRRTLAPGGLLLYETFTRNSRHPATGPRNPAFLLDPGELRELFSDLEILDYWEGLSDADPPEALARLAARRP